MLADLFTACTGSAMLTAWGLALHCGPLLFAVVGALPSLAQLAQLPAAWLVTRRGARHTTVAAVTIARFLPLLLAPLPFLPVAPATQKAIFVCIVAVSAILAVVGNNGWATWMGELVPTRLRGRYFGRRTALCTLAGTLGALGTGLFVDAARRRGLESHALSALALVACALGVGTTSLLRRQVDANVERAIPRWAQLVEPWRDPSMRRALRFNLGWNAAVGLAATLFQVHMVRNLGLGMLTVSIYVAAYALARMLTAPLWGAAIDRVGCKPVVLLCAMGIAVDPAIWLFASPSVHWPLLADVLIGGTLWAGLNQALFQLPLRIAPRRGRAFHLAAFAAAGGLAFALASAVGGSLAQTLPTQVVVHGHALSSFEVVFVISTAARCAALMLAAKLDEPGAREVEALLRFAAAQGRVLRLRVPARTAK
ncbi:MAG: MFS transporter [Deltaproteobacteria bacterium]|nr:MFS transporter [Deltaproteobacteria bacterium]